MAEIARPRTSRGLHLRWALAGAAEQPRSAASWRESIRLGEEVPLGRFILDAQDRLSRPAYRFRRTARPLLRPHLALNNVQPTWQAEIEKVDEKTTPAYIGHLYLPDQHARRRFQRGYPLFRAPAALGRPGSATGRAAISSARWTRSVILPIRIFAAGNLCPGEDPANESDELVLRLTGIGHPPRLLWLGAEPGDRLHAGNDSDIHRLRLPGA